MTAAVRPVATQMFGFRRGLFGSAPVRYDAAMGTAGTDKPGFSSEEAFATHCDADDPLAAFRHRFFIPPHRDGSEVIYFAGNSLGLQPRTVREVLDEELEDWARLGVEAHFEGRRPWYTYNEQFRGAAARLVGAKETEVVLMNTLTVNLHLMMVSFYRPTATRYRIVMEDAAFPSDTYAVKTQLAYHGIDPADALIIARPRDGEHLIRTEDFEALLNHRGDEIALVMLAGVNYFTGQVFDMRRIAAAARRRGCLVGFDLAHAAGNVPLSLHDWDVDFAAWCNYKYLNSGPGAVAGCFVHERHARNPGLPRFGGWWGNDPETRFRMHLEPNFLPREGADGWQISNPPIMALAPVKASYDLFDAVGLPALREKSLRLTGYLQFLLDDVSAERFEVITPREPEFRGCQLSIMVHDRPRELLAALKDEGVICDFRAPNVIRVAPVPLYNTFLDVWRFANILSRHDHVSRTGRGGA